ncbi:hypothetical protein ANN_11231 [Periplaneta americana]|uniref:Uncharacterized protein n=1 Tax=Periplaneta americana TaxID=6978 RepID=A0ABQ8T5U9_PERAM|nr:hypothetical protein ANN_11231 [Periplaneta americana]
MRFPAGLKLRSGAGSIPAWADYLVVFFEVFPNNRACGGPLGRPPWICQSMVVGDPAAEPTPLPTGGVAYTSDRLSDGRALKQKPPGRRRSVRSPQNIAIVRQAFIRSPQRSARKHSAALQLSNPSLSRLRFAKRFLDILSNNIVLLMSHEAHFHLSGSVNKQNLRYWAKENPKETNIRPLHSERVTVGSACLFACNMHNLMASFGFSLGSLLPFSEILCDSGSTVPRETMNYARDCGTRMKQLRSALRHRYSSRRNVVNKFDRIANSGNVSISAFPNNQVVSLYHILLSGVHRYWKLQLIDFSGHEKPLHAQKRNPVTQTSYNGWGGHRANHTIHPFWLDDRPLLLRHVAVRPAAGWSVLALRGL